MPAPDPTTLRLLERARTFLDAHSELSLDMRTVAQVAGFSEFHFIRTFKAAYGITPYQYLRRRRIVRARALLEARQLSITEISLAVGFGSPGAFATTFQREMGASPRTYRTRVWRGITLPPPYVPRCFLRMFGARGVPDP